MLLKVRNNVEAFNQIVNSLLEVQRYVCSLPIHLLIQQRFICVVARTSSLQLSIAALYAVQSNNLILFLSLLLLITCDRDRND